MFHRATYKNVGMALNLNHLIVSAPSCIMQLSLYGKVWLLAWYWRAFSGSLTHVFSGSVFTFSLTGQPKNYLDSCGLVVISRRISESVFNVCHPEVFNTSINIQWCVSQTQQNFIMFIIVLGQHVSILIESSSGPSKKTDPYLKG